MARRSRLIYVLLFVTLIYVLCMVFGVEWTYKEKLKQDDRVRGLSDRTFLHSRRLNWSNVVVQTKANFDSQKLDKTLTNSKTSFLEEQLKSHFNRSHLYKVLRSRKIKELRVDKSMRELWWYSRKRMEILKEHLYKGNDIINDTLSTIREHYIALRWRHDQLQDSDELSLKFNSTKNLKPLQLNWKYWQHNISVELTKLMEKRLTYLQNPSNCQTAKKLLCEVGKYCGFGCEIHHVAYCFIMAYATKRVLVLDSKHWQYTNEGWSAVFQTVSSTCTPNVTNSTLFRIDSRDDTIFLPVIDNFFLKPVQAPMAVPRDLADRMMSFHGYPFIWFIAQFLKYLMRPSTKLKEYLTEKRKALGIVDKDSPIIGVHVRRSDKSAEARYHDIKEYMEQVEEWYDWYELSNGVQGKIKRKIYIATDEPSVVKEARYKYPHYGIYNDQSVAYTANRLSSRYSLQGLFGLIFDVTMLSECDFIVCTFSSQVCRLAYELMQSNHIDASRKFYSLDDVYYFGGQQPHNVVAIQSHKSTKSQKQYYEKVPDVNFEEGDLLGIAGNEKDGYSVGIHRKSQQKGKYPSYKVEEQVLVADFPSFDEVK